MEHIQRGFLIQGFQFPNTEHFPTFQQTLDFPTFPEIKTSTKYPVLLPIFPEIKTSTKYPVLPFLDAIVF